MSEIKVRALDSVFDPTQRRDILVPERSSVAEIVRLAHADAPEPLRRDVVRAFIDGVEVPVEMWPQARPKAGTTVVLQATPQGDVLKNVLTIAVTASAIAMGQFYGPLLANSLVFGSGAAGSGLLGSASTLAITGSTPCGGPMLKDALA